MQTTTTVYRMLALRNTHIFIHTRARLSVRYKRLGYGGTVMPSSADYVRRAREPHAAAAV
ncbi:hypothetical protein [Microbacterium sp. YY-01]|uniref:hypothetical protein n=1 Tax=Microbacterium sp. YY-01 TaxID=3421634 RepID=UPI003D16A641